MPMLLTLTRSARQSHSLLWWMPVLLLLVWTQPAQATAPQHEQVKALGEGLQFLNGPVPEGATTPEAGAQYKYARTHSANSRNSPVGIEVWVFDASGAALHTTHADYLKQVYAQLYTWDPAVWKTQLSDSEEAAEILQKKSDLFWESLAQHLAERVLADETTPALYRFGPQCLDAAAKGCTDAGLPQAHRVVVRTYLNARRDPTNPVTRSITYIVHRGQLSDPELFFELQVPNGLKVAGPSQELLDFRPKIAGRQDAVSDIRIWAHIPRGKRSRTKNFDYPDYNLVFVPIRHLVVQGEVEDPKQPATAFDYPDLAALVDRVGTMVALIRTPQGGQAVADQLRPFITDKYYYMFAGGQGLESYRDYVLGKTAGVGRGLNPDFGTIELLIDGSRVAQFPGPAAQP